MMLSSNSPPPTRSTATTHDDSNNSISPPNKVWFFLMDSNTGEPYRGTTASCVTLPSGASVYQFRDAVKVKYNQPDYLQNLPSSVLQVYKNRISFDEKRRHEISGLDHEHADILNKRRHEDQGLEEEEPLKACDCIDGLGETMQEALVVVMPRSFSTALRNDNVDRASDVRIGIGINTAAVKEPHPARKKRWIDEINRIVEQAADADDANDNVDDNVDDEDNDSSGGGGGGGKRFKSCNDDDSIVPSDTATACWKRIPPYILSRVPRKEPHPDRKKRWMELNLILEQAAMDAATADADTAAGVGAGSDMFDTGSLLGCITIAWSTITWDQVKSVFHMMTSYVQPRRAIEQVSIVDDIATYLSFSTQYLKSASTGGGDAKRPFLIAPIFIGVSNLFLQDGNGDNNNDVRFVVEDDLQGCSVKAHGHFDFMMRRGKRAACVVVVKNDDDDDDLEQGIAQALVGCEVAIEMGDSYGHELDVVYGIVTNYTQWIFLRSLDDRIEMDKCWMSVTPNGPERGSLQSIFEKIYALFADD